jgi:hypothetical protein
VPGIFIRTEFDFSFPLQLMKIQSAPGFGRNFVRFYNAAIARSKKILQAVKLNFNAEGAIGKVLQHGVLVLQPDNEPMGNRHLLAFLTRALAPGSENTLERGT